MATIKVNLQENSYEILIKRGILNDACKELNLNRKVLVVTDDGVPSEYAKKVLKQCKNGFLYSFPSGEESKNLQTYEKVLVEMLNHNFSRKDCVVAVGGGVVGDLAGFAAASYMRGIDFYNIPTTVLSQVDSSIGGKTAVNLNGVKNIVGAFFQPKKVLIDPEVFKTLPLRQISNGLAESLKMSMTFDPELFEIFKNENPFEKIDEIIEKSLIIKKNVVEKDEKEAGLRKVLNFGHTIGHGIESTLLDGTLHHGECVSLGMIPMCSPEVRKDLIKCLEKLNLPTSFKIDEDKVCDAISHDKKSSESSISTVFVPEIGKFEFRNLTVSQIKELLPMINK